MEHCVPPLAAAQLGFPCLASSSCSHLGSDEACAGGGVSPRRLSQFGVSLGVGEPGGRPGLWSEQPLLDLPGSCWPEGYPWLHQPGRGVLREPHVYPRALEGLVLSLRGIEMGLMHFSYFFKHF